MASGPVKLQTIVGGVPSDEPAFAVIAAALPAAPLTVGGVTRTLPDHLADKATKADIAGIVSDFDPLSLSPMPPTIDIVGITSDGIAGSWFNRPSPGFATSATGLLKAFPASQPRIAFDAASGLAKGMLAEETRANSTRNSGFVGAVAGSPGTLPGPAGVGAIDASVSVAATGLVGDAPYIDLDFIFTAANGSVTLRWNGTITTVVPASAGASWTHSVYAALLSGDPANLISADLSVSSRDNTGALIAGSAVTTSLLGATSALARYSVTAAMATSTAYVAEGITLTARVATTIRMRFVLPQLELGAFRTSPILTRGTALARSADALAVPVDAMSVSAAGNTIRVAGYAPDPDYLTGSATLFCLDNGTSTERLIARFVRVQTGVSVAVVMVVGGATIVNIALGTLPMSAEARIALDYQFGSLRASLNGGPLVTAAPAVLPAMPTTLRGGNDAAATRYLNAPLKRLSLIPRPQATNAGSIITGMSA